MPQFPHEKWDINPTWHTIHLPFLAITLMVGVYLLALRWTRKRHPSLASTEDKNQKDGNDAKGPIITALKNFEWENARPLQLRPFQGKDKYNLTMGETSLLFCNKPKHDMQEHIRS